MFLPHTSFFGFSKCLWRSYHVHCLLHSHLYGYFQMRTFPQPTRATCMSPTISNHLRTIPFHFRWCLASDCAVLHGHRAAALCMRQRAIQKKVNFLIIASLTFSTRLFIILTFYGCVFFWSFASSSVSNALNTGIFQTRDPDSGQFHLHSGCPCCWLHAGVFIAFWWKCKILLWSKSDLWRVM